MSKKTLRHLEERLRWEAPSLEWECGPVPGTPILAGTRLPEEVQICAWNGGIPVKGSPFYISGECLLRWGFDASVTLICNELTPGLHAHSDRTGMDWDRLAEI